MNAPIFHDPKGRRWRRVKRTWFALAVVITALAVIFILSVLANPVLPSFKLRQLTSLPHREDLKPKRPNVPRNPEEQRAKKSKAELQHALAVTKGIVPGKLRSQIAVVTPPAVLPTPLVPTSRPLSIGFYTNWDDSSYESLKRNLDHLDWVIPEWIHLQDSANANPLVVDIDAPALNWVRETRPQVRILPMVQNRFNEKFDGQLLSRVIGDEQRRQAVIGSLASFVQQNRFAGVCVDFEEVPDDAQTNLLIFMKELHDRFSPNGLLVTQSVPFAEQGWNYVELGAATDYLVLMAYDQHWSRSDPGPVAAQTWFEQTLVARMRELNPSKTIIALGNYGYDWGDQQKEARELTFQEALITARESEAQPAFDVTSRTLSFEYDEDDGSHHTVWFLDAVTAYNQMRSASGFKPAGFAVWRLGSEDPSIWSILGVPGTSPEALRQINYGYTVDFEGNGELLKVVSAQPQPGSRTLEVDSQSGYIKNEQITAIPASFVIERTGDRPGLLALTFDDGPDPRWTPAILDILQREHVPATFFIVGKHGEAYPDLVRRIVDEGHEIGNHTFTHPNLGEVPLSLTRLELTATQRLIESLTGRSTVLFRPPYFGDAEADRPQEVQPAYVAQQMGYVVVGVRIDPDDWKMPVTANDIVNRTVDRALDANPETRGEVILLHDSGGDRSATVEALPELIHRLKQRGFRFVGVSELGGWNRDQVMPPIPASESVFTRADAVTFFALSLGGWLLQWIFIIGILLGLGRLLFVGSLAFAQWLRSRHRQQSHYGSDFAPFVSVIVPAFNEELVIANTIRSLLASDYPSCEIIVVDDGSQDNTSNVVRQHFGNESRVRLFTITNNGKAEALNTGLRYSKGEVIVALDSDTLFAPETIRALANRFFDPDIGAVAGNAKVGNRTNIVTRWQALEYITSQNMDRRAFASLNCITVVPGAVGAWRRDLLEKAGGFASDTLAEDQDLTLRVRRLGYKIGYEETAVAWTEAPDRLKTLARQRFRWAYGTLQCMWKHRDALFRFRYGALGFVAMPNVWIFQILFALLSPVMDLMLVYTLVATIVDRIQQPSGYSSTNLQQVLFYYALFLAIDWMSACFAFMLERKERWGLLWWLFLQRFCYRQVMYYVMIKSVAIALQGPVVGWGKLERKATAEAQP